MTSRKLYRGAKAVKGWLETLWYPIFCLTGKKPYSFGYGYYKKKEILRSIAKGLFNDGNLRPGYGFRIDERIVEYPWLFSRLPTGRANLLDAGSILNYDYLVNKEPVSSKKLFISTLAPELACLWFKNISYVYEDLRETCYRDDLFDYIVSISSIEHIGLDNTMLYTNDRAKQENATDGYLAAVAEYHRILKPSGRLYLSVPFGKAANHGWFQVFDKTMVDRILETFVPRSHVALYFKYESDGWRRADCEELAEATFFDVHKQKKLAPDFAAAARGLVCLEMKKIDPDEQ